MDPDANLAPPPKQPDAIPTAAIPGQAPSSLPAPVRTDPSNWRSPNSPQQDVTTSVNNEAAEADPYGEQPSKMEALLANKKLLAIIGGGVLLLLILLVAVAASSSSTSNGANRGTNSAQASLPEIISRPDGTLDLSRRVDNSKALRAQKVETSGINQQVNLTSGVSMMAGAIGNYNASSGDVAGTGKKFIIILVVVGNSSLKDNISLSYLDFKLLDKGNKLIAPSPITQQISNNSLAYPIEIKPGSQLEGRLIYEVEGDGQSWTLNHKESYRKSSDNTTFVVEGKIKLNVKANSEISDEPGDGPGDETNGEDSANNDNSSSSHEGHNSENATGEEN